MASTNQQPTVEEKLEEARPTIVEGKLEAARASIGEGKAKFDRAFFAFEMFQVFLLVLAGICGMWSCSSMISATKTAENFEPKVPGYFCRSGELGDWCEQNPFDTNSCRAGDDSCYQRRVDDCNRCRNEGTRTDCPCDIGMHPTGGDMVSRNGGGCQVHFRLAEALGLTPTEVTAATISAGPAVRSSGTLGKVGFGDKVSAALNKALFGGQKDAKKDVTIACPIDLDDDADCSLTTSDWEVYKNRDQDDWQQSSNFYAYVMFMIPIWVILKMLSLDGELIDMLIRKITCGLIQKNEGRLDDLMLDFDCMERYPKARFICVNLVKYLRFKLASNALIWPLTTIGFSSKCGDHVYTKMPHEVVWEIASCLVLLDGGYLLLYYFVMSCCETIKTYRVLYLPFLAAAAMSIVIQVYTVAFTGSFSFILGWNFSLAFNFKMSFSFNAFGVIFSILSVFEQFSLFVTVGKQIRKQGVDAANKALDKAQDAHDAANKVLDKAQDAHDAANKVLGQAQDASNKVQNAGAKSVNLLESTVLGAVKNTESNHDDKAI